jgi:asparagine synthase (glutamine-hydrolysing)
MPGLIGFTKSSLQVHNPAAVALAMQDSLIHRPCHCIDDLFDDPCICASRVYLDTVRDGPQPCGSADVFVWFDGEFYNQDDFGVSARSDIQRLLEQYHLRTLVPFLKKVDGIFTAVIYDRTKKTVTIVNDRYGLRYLYISQSPAGCVWASELKAFRCLPSRSFTIDRETAAQFFSKGYCSGNRTWFRDVELLAPGTMLTIKCATGETNALKYLDWSVSVARNEVNDLPELARELGVRFKRAVDRRCRVDERIGLGLSGGLDSRAIFAAMPSHCEPIQAFTFGMTDSKDLRIAQKATALRPSKHCLYELSANNWLQNRADAVWWTDGQYNLLHMHGVEHAGAIRENFEVTLNGFQSDALLGACYENSEGEEMPKYPDRDRRFIAMGIVLATQNIICRIPFFDNDLMELTLSIPLQYRRNSYIFHRMLLLTFPEYYQHIPWQRTNMPISRNSPIDKALFLAKKCAGRLASKYKVRLHDDGYTDYPSWIRQSPARGFFAGLLTDTHARIFDFVDPALIRRYLHRHMHGLNYDELIGRYATFELWLRRFYGSG